MSMAADRFADLLAVAGAAPRPLSATQRAAAQPFAPAARLLVRDGLHSGAWMSLHGQRLRLGSAADGDIVLTDAAMPPLAAHLVRTASGWQLEAVDAAAANDARRSTLSEGQTQAGRWRRRRWQLHGVTLVVIDTAPPPAPLPAARAESRRLAWTLGGGMAATLLIIAGIVGFARASTLAPGSRIVRAMPALQALQLPDVRLRSTPDGAIELVGHVADAAQFDVLTQWQQHADLRDARLRVHQGATLINQVHQALGNSPDAKVSYVGGGRVRIEGSTRSAELKRRVQSLTTELRGAATIEDQLALSEARVGPATKRVLPINIVNVMQGDRPYFQTADGATYFIGATMPDGAVVVAFFATHIEFVLDGRPVIHPLSS